MTGVVVVREKGTAVVVAPATETRVVEINAGGGVSPAYVAGAILAHEESATPHPIYDEQPSFTLLFENGLV